MDVSPGARGSVVAGDSIDRKAKRSEPVARVSRGRMPVPRSRKQVPRPRPFDDASYLTSC